MGKKGEGERALLELTGCVNPAGDGLYRTFMKNFFLYRTISFGVYGVSIQQQQQQQRQITKPRHEQTNKSSIVHRALAKDLKLLIMAMK